LNAEELRELGQSSVLSDGNPGVPNSRRQDVLNANTRIYLVNTENLQHPSKPGWSHSKSRGAALDFLYNSGYKGTSKSGQSNAKVGGALETPSFVWITSNNLQEPTAAYQVITIFGVDQSDRTQFCQNLRTQYSGQNSANLIEIIP
jgi:CRISPR-associated protein Cmr6